LGWTTIYEEDRISIRMEEEDGSLILEVNDGGFAPDYVTVRLDRRHARKLLDALTAYEVLVSRGQA